MSIAGQEILTLIAQLSHEWRNLSISLNPGGGTTTPATPASSGQHFGSYLEDQKSKVQIDAKMWQLQHVIYI